MKKYISVFSLMAQISIYRIFGLLLLLAAADGVLAWYWLSVKDYDLANLFRNGNGGFGLVLAIIFVMMAVVQIRRGDLYSGPQGYTMKRLGISEKAVTLLQILYNMVCWIILWGMQVLIFYLICKFYNTIGVDSENPLHHQQMFLVFYLSPLLHSLVPMEETLTWIANLVMIIELSISSACWTMYRREKQSGASLLIGYWAVILLFRRELDSFIWNVVIIGGFLIIIAIDSYRIFFRKKEV